METSRFKSLKASKFDTLSNEDLEEVMGGLCISCMQRERKIKIGSTVEAEFTYDYHDGFGGKVSVGVEF